MPTLRRLSGAKDMARHTYILSRMITLQLEVP